MTKLKGWQWALITGGVVSSVIAMSDPFQATGALALTFFAAGIAAL